MINVKVGGKLLLRRRCYVEIGIPRFTFVILHLIFTIVYFSPPAAAQEPPNSYKFSHLNIQNGLASNHVSAILQDRRGFIWIASTALQRYDGSNLITVASFDKVPGSIYYDDICLCEDSKGRIWMGAPDNIHVYDPATSGAEALKVDILPSLQGNLQCSHIVEDHAGVIWATTQEGLLRFNDSTRRFEKPALIPEPQRLQMNSAIIEDQEGQLWISGVKGIFLLSRDRKRLYSADNNPAQLPVFTIGRSIRKFFIDQQHHLWIASRGAGLYRYNPASRDLQVYKMGEIFDITADQEHNIWVATEQDGIARFDDSRQQFMKNIRADNADDLGLHYDFESNCLLADREGHLWIGTDKGVNILSLHNPTFRLMDHRTEFSGTRLRLPRAEVTDLFQATNGDIYVGYWGQGFSWLDGRLGLKRNFTYGEAAPAYAIPEGRSLVWSFAEMPDGRILVGQENGYLSEFDPRQGKFLAHHRPRAFQDQTLMSLYVEDDTCIWVGLYKRGLARWNPQRDTAYGYPQLLDNIQRQTSVMDIAGQNDSLLWLATSNAGLVLFNKHRGQVVTRDIFRDGARSVNNITCLYKPDDTTLVAGTDHGIWVFNTRRHTVQPLKINGVLFDEWVLSMRADASDGIWFTTPYGFYRFHRRQFELETFVQGDNIIDNNRRVRRRIIQLKDGRLLAGASDHFLAFDPAVLKVAPPPPDVTILTFKALDSTIQLTREPVALSYQQNFISIEFKSLQYHHEKIRYYYQLEGLDPDWVSADGLLIAKYTNLPPGSYTFKVRSVNAAGTFSEKTTSQRIIIKPAFWQTNWFRLLVLAAIAALVYVYFRARIYYIKKEARQRAAMQQKIAQLEMKALRAQMNPHFIFNALNSIQTFMMKSETEQALNYLNRFARLIRSVLDHSQLNTIPISKEVSMLENYIELEKLRFADQFSYRISIDPALDPDFTEIPAMIIQPFIENAIWHGLLHRKEGGCLQLSFTKMQDRILCVIEDNGVGRQKSAALKLQSGYTHASRGLQITRDRLSLYNSRFNMDACFDIEDIFDDAGQPAGTRVNLWFPLVED
ncbi:sensor histidine kinase [Chitinophaga japonensis]|uniref:Two component regulator with propeller domain n=1 Tax=Chitinophaga japonensis TaxID=104662 RepID=A0A562TFT6_CHIJA|nr:sensor histidine kinase [Chitinophaga japonensis]TWI92401.1 two component regulator with propeller domain [Chitinophaga japonensis]